MELSNRRGVRIDVSDQEAGPIDDVELGHWEEFDLIYRSLCAVLYNYVPMSGHPGGSISSGRMVAALLFEAMDYDLSDPDREDADIISYAAGHKALGLYAMWALRNEVARIGAPQLLPEEPFRQLRLEDLLGFRRNPVTRTRRFSELGAKALDGHPTPATPFVRLCTGASGVGLASSLGLALAALDGYGRHAPRVHIVEGEGGLTPGRVAEALAAAGTSRLGNAVLHIDWNQASIDSNAVCRDGATPGDYVQWDPMELCALHDWNVIYVPDGSSFRQILRAQRLAASLTSLQPTAIVYRTTKGWQYGIEGKASHGAGHKLCSDGFYAALAPLTGGIGTSLPTCESTSAPCKGDPTGEILENCLWDALCFVRTSLEERPALVAMLAARLRAARQRLEERKRVPRKGAPDVEAVYRAATQTEIPPGLVVAPGSSTTLRAELARVLNHLNLESGGALLIAAADLLDSTSVSAIARGFPAGYWNPVTNPDARVISIGGICEDAMCGMLAGASAFGRHLGVASSYGAFIAPLGHIAARLHAIGRQARPDGPARTFILVCAHAGLKTGEDGPTHADPQPLQLLQENFPRGSMITLTPWDPQELYFTMIAALAHRPSIVAPFVTRPNEMVLDRAALRIPPAEAAAQGVYALRRANGNAAGTVVLQGSAVTYAFLQVTLPLLDEQGIELDVFHVSSAELFDLLPRSAQQRVFTEANGREAMGITDFTLPTMYRWVTSDRGRAATLHPFHKGHYLGSGPGQRVLEEAGLDGESQFRAIMRYVREH